MLCGRNAEEKLNDLYSSEEWFRPALEQTHKNRPRNFQTAAQCAVESHAVHEDEIVSAIRTALTQTLRWRQADVPDVSFETIRLSNASLCRSMCVYNMQAFAKLVSDHNLVKLSHVDAFNTHNSFNAYFKIEHAVAEQAALASLRFSAHLLSAAGVIGGSYLTSPDPRLIHSTKNWDWGGRSVLLFVPFEQISETWKEKMVVPMITLERSLVLNVIATLETALRNHGPAFSVIIKHNLPQQRYVEYALKAVFEHAFGGTRLLSLRFVWHDTPSTSQPSYGGEIHLTFHSHMVEHGLVSPRPVTTTLNMDTHPLQDPILWLGRLFSDCFSSPLFESDEELCNFDNACATRAFEAPEDPIPLVHNSVPLTILAMFCMFPRTLSYNVEHGKVYAKPLGALLDTESVARSADAKIDAIVSRCAREFAGHDLRNERVVPK